MIKAIIALLLAFGIDQPTVNNVQNILVATQTPQVTTQQTTTTTEPVATSTQTTPLFGSVPCVDSPIFNFAVSKTEVPYGQSANFEGGVQSSCTGKYLPYGQWKVTGNDDDGNLQRGVYTYDLYRFGKRNWGTHATTTWDIVISSMGQSATTTLTLDASN